MVAPSSACPSARPAAGPVAGLATGFAATCDRARSRARRAGAGRGGAATRRAQVRPAAPRERLEAELAVSDCRESHRFRLRDLRPARTAARSAFLMMPTATADDWAVVARRMRRCRGAGRLPGVAGRGRSARTARGAPAGRAVASQLASGGTGGARAGSPTSRAATAPERLRPETGPRPRRRDRRRRRVPRLAARPSTCRAAAGTPDGVGRERYLRRRPLLTGADLDVDEAYAWAWDEFHRIGAEMRAEAGRVAARRHRCAGDGPPGRARPRGRGRGGASGPGCSS